MCVYVHTHITGSLHFKMENAQETNQVANQTPMQLGHTVCSIFLSQVTNCTEWLTAYFPLFCWCLSLQWLKRLNKHGKATSDSYISPQKRGCPKAFHNCLTTLHRLDDKQGELEVHRVSHGSESVWNSREVVGQGSWHGHWWVQLVWEGRGWRGRKVTLHIIDHLDHIQCQHGTKGLSIDNPRLGLEGKATFDMLWWEFVTNNALKSIKVMKRKTLCNNKKCLLVTDPDPHSRLQLSWHSACKHVPRDFLTLLGEISWCSCWRGKLAKAGGTSLYSSCCSTLKYWWEIWSEL